VTVGEFFTSNIFIVATELRVSSDELSWISIKKMSSDGVGRVLGRYKNSLISAPNVIYLDEEDFPEFYPTKEAAKTVIHELIHWKQAQTFIGRLWMFWYNLTEEYSKRDHEKEAKAESLRIVNLLKF
jgi:hypothetical protein